MKKLNNKGFSLVELIVVVLIMAIIAVALAPQVMKWVEESRKSTDANNYDTIVEACNTALADQNTLKESNTAIVLKADDGTNATREWAVDGGASGHNYFDEQMKEILGASWADSLQVKASETVAKNTATGEWNGAHIVYTITVEKGHVYRTVDTTGAQNANS